MVRTSNFLEMATDGLDLSEYGIYSTAIKETMMDQIFKVTTSLLVVVTHIQLKKPTRSSTSRKMSMINIFLQSPELWYQMLCS